MPLDSRTRATLRSAEFGFFGVMVLTRVQTPFFCGQPCIAGCLGLRYCWTRGFRTSWLIVGIVMSSALAQATRDPFILELFTVVTPVGPVKGETRRKRLLLTPSPPWRGRGEGVTGSRSAVR